MGGFPACSLGECMVITISFTDGMVFCDLGPYSFSSVPASHSVEACGSTEFKSPAIQSLGSFFLFDPNFPWSPLAAILTDTLIENFLSMSGTWGVSPYWFLGKLWVLYIILYIVIFHPEIFCIESGGSVPSVLAIGYHIGQTYLYYFSNEEKKYPEFENVF